jgi:hypothetical protein
MAIIRESVEVNVRGSLDNNALKLIFFYIIIRIHIFLLFSVKFNWKIEIPAVHLPLRALQCLVGQRSNSNDAKI